MGSVVIDGALHSPVILDWVDHGRPAEELGMESDSVGVPVGMPVGVAMVPAVGLAVAQVLRPEDGGRRVPGLVPVDYSVIDPPGLPGDLVRVSLGHRLPLSHAMKEVPRLF